VTGVVVAAAAPRSYRVVNVPVPAELAGASKVTYEVVASGNVPLLGARTGAVARGRVVVLTVGVPTSAQAGLTRAGFVRFTAAGATPVRAPIDVAIARIARIDVMTQSMRGEREPAARTAAQRSSTPATFRTRATSRSTRPARGTRDW
jgi:hypothetical protein